MCGYTAATATNVATTAILKRIRLLMPLSNSDACRELQSWSAAAQGVGARFFGSKYLTQIG